MPWLSGTIGYIKVGRSLTVVELVTARVREPLLLWGDLRGGTDPVQPAFDTVVHSMQLSLLKEAMFRGLTVRIFIAEASAYIRFVEVSAPP